MEVAEKKLFSIFNVKFMRLSNVTREARPPPSSLSLNLAHNNNHIGSKPTMLMANQLNCCNFDKLAWFRKISNIFRVIMIVEIELAVCV